MSNNWQDISYSEQRAVLDTIVMGLFLNTPHVHIITKEKMNVYVRNVGNSIHQ
jgi:hypothetical protein